MSKTVYILHSPFDFSFSRLRVWLRIEFLAGNVNILETLLRGPAASVSVGTSKAILLLCDPASFRQSPFIPDVRAFHEKILPMVCFHSLW